MTTMFELLMQLPIFCGVSRQRMQEVVGKAKFHFLKYPAGETIIRAGEPCTHINFIISGRARAVTSNESGRFAIEQTLNAPILIAPEFLFGRRTSFPYTLTAIDDTSLLKISKADFMTIIYSDRVFMLNFLNTLSVSAQKASEGIMSLSSGEIEERIAYWIVALTHPQATDIKLIARKRDLCSVFGAQRATYDSGMAKLTEQGVIRYSATEIDILDRPALAAMLFKNHE